MSERFNAADVALVRRLRTLEAANFATIRASAQLVATMIDAREERKLPACAGHEALTKLGNLVTGAIELQSRSLSAHESLATLGTSLGLPVTAFGDTCQDPDFFMPFFTGARLVEQAA